MRRDSTEQLLVPSRASAADTRQSDVHCVVDSDAASDTDVAAADAELEAVAARVGRAALLAAAQGWVARERRRSSRGGEPGAAPPRAASLPHAAGSWRGVVVDAPPCPPTPPPRLPPHDRHGQYAHGHAPQLDAAPDGCGQAPAELGRQSLSESFDRHSSAISLRRPKSPQAPRSPLPAPPPPERAAGFGGAAGGGGGDGRDEGVLIAFAAVEYLLYEADLSITVKVVRRGSTAHAVHVDWATQNGGADGDTYIQQGGIAVIPAGARSAEIPIRIRDNTRWNLESMFTVALDCPRAEGAGGDPAHTPVLGELSRTTVVILNDDDFPNCHDAARIRTATWRDHSSRAHLIVNFLLHLVKLIPGDVARGLLYRTGPAVYKLNEELLMLFILRTLVAGQNSASCERAGMCDRTWVLLGLSVLFGANLLLIQICANGFLKLRLSGKASQTLRKSMFGTALQFSPDSEDKFSPGMVAQTMDHHVEVAVTTTWCSLFDLHKDAMKLIVTMVFDVWLFKEANLPPMFYPLPALLFVFNSLLLMTKIEEQGRRALDVSAARQRWIDRLLESTRLRRLITTYRQGPKVIDEFAAQHADFNLQAWLKAMFEKHILMQMQWVPQLVSSGIIFYAGYLHIKTGVPDFGTFVALVYTSQGFGDNLADIFGDLFLMGDGFASIQKIAEQLNANTRRKQLLRAEKRREGLLQRQTAEERDMFRQATGESNIVADHVSFTFGAERAPWMRCVATEERAGSVPSAPSIHFRAEAGQVICITGQSHIGKRTILRLLARHFVPDAGFILYPPNWRVRFIDTAPQMFDATVMHNLRFGNQFDHPESEVWALCDRIGLNDFGLSHAERGEMPVGHEGAYIAYSDCVLISIARALLSSVDFLLLANILDMLGPDAALRVVSVLREMTALRGIPTLATEYGRTPEHLKKQKVVFIVTKSPQVAAACDHIITVGDQSTGSHLTCSSAQDAA